MYAACPCFVSKILVSSFFPNSCRAAMSQSSPYALVIARARSSMSPTLLCCAFQASNLLCPRPRPASPRGGPAPPRRPPSPPPLPPSPSHNASSAPASKTFLRNVSGSHPNTCASQQPSWKTATRSSLRIDATRRRATTIVGSANRRASKAPAARPAHPHGGAAGSLRPCATASGSCRTRPCSRARTSIA